MQTTLVIPSDVSKRVHNSSKLKIDDFLISSSFIISKNFFSSVSLEISSLNLVAESISCRSSALSLCFCRSIA